MHISEEFCNEHNLGAVSSSFIVSISPLAETFDKIMSQKKETNAMNEIRRNSGTIENVMH